MAQAFDDRYQAYMDAIRRRVCAVCLDQRDDGTCQLAGGRLCAIEAKLPRVLDALLAVRSDRMEEYFEAVKDQICAGCRGQDQEGHCAVGEAGECALWMYLPLLVDAADEVTQALGPPSTHRER
jgi:hypothetical protein